MSHSKIISHICSGMGNRFKCLLGALYHTTKEVRVHWPRYLDGHMLSHNEAQIEPYADILNNGLQTVADQQIVHTMCRHQGWVTRSTYKWFDDVDADFLFDTTQYSSRWPIMLDLADRYLVPSDKVKAIYNARIAAVSKCAHGVFVRTGDTQRTEYPMTFWRTDDYTIDPDVWTFVVGDSPRVYEYYQNWSKVVCFLEDDYMYGGWPGHFANMLLLAQCAFLTVPKVSTYAEIVYLLSRFQAQVRPITQTKGRGKAYQSMPISESRAYRQRLFDQSKKE